jgi:xylose dehydrogenase (NAD/NADP)
MTVVRWGLLSTANINRRLIPTIRASMRGELVAIASRTQNNADVYAKEWEIPIAFGSYQEMLDSGAIDAVYISLPNHLHPEWTIKALNAGVHVLCEKPFALTVSEVDQMIDAARKNNRVLAEAFMYRHHPQTKITGEWVRSGRLGEITLIQSVFNFHIEKRANNIRLNPKVGGGSLWDVGVYPLSFAQYIAGGTPLWVSGCQWVGETGVDETYVGQMGFSSGCLAQISSSLRTPFYTYASVIGTQGRLELTKPFVGLDKNRQMVFYSKDGESEEIPVPDKNLYLGEVQDLHAAILDGAPTYLSLEETRNHIRTTTALYESAKIGQIVQVE